MCCTAGVSWHASPHCGVLNEWMEQKSMMGSIKDMNRLCLSSGPFAALVGKQLHGQQPHVCMLLCIAATPCHDHCIGATAVLLSVQPEAAVSWMF